MHSNYFYKSRYNKYKREVQKMDLAPKLNLSQFTSVWDVLANEGEKKIYQKIIYSERYSTSYKTALAEVRAARLLGRKLSLNEAKRMTTQDFADMFKKEIATSYARFRKQAGANYAKLAISQYFFGSN